MSFSNYEIIIISPNTGNVLKVLTPLQIREVKFSKVLNGVGAFALIFQGTDQIEEVFPLITTDTFIEIYRTARVAANTVSFKEETYLVEKLQRYVDPAGVDTFILSGKSLLTLLSRRLIRPENDSVQPNGGYATKAGTADNVIRDYVREQVGDLAGTVLGIDRSIPGLTVPPVAGLGAPVGKRLRLDNLLEVCIDLCIGGNVDIELVRVSGLELSFNVGPVGSDRSYKTNKYSGTYTVFDPKRGNLQAPQYEIDESKEVTLYYVMGPGQGAEREILVVPNNIRINASPYHLIEKTLEARNSSTTTAIERLTLGREALIDHGVEVDFTADFTADIGGTVYHEDWELGDTITIQWDSLQDTIRISKIEFTLSVEGEKLEVKLKKFQ